MTRLLRNPIGWAGLLIVVVLACASTLSIIPETSQALVVRMGKPDRVVNRYRPGQGFGGDGAGLLAHIPLVEQVVVIDKRVRDIDMERQPVLSTDQLRLEVDAFARYRITDPLRMYLAARGDERRVGEALKPILGSALRNELGRRPFAALLTPERDTAMRNIRDALNRIAAQYGAQIVDVRINRAELPDGTPLDSAFERMRSARRQQAMTIRAEGMKQAAILRGQADADASRIYADAFGKDPDFYDFYRSMQSYRAAFAPDGENIGGTTLVLSPNSAYFRNFINKGK
ncbi:protease modulator HflC [Sphingomonas morindae]|uniref:Protein HflC n=1 Tax=Sphingomonas morindae TaxID=1541170 RepID=A0ABY4XCW9_9SPHN|nr:protease modulator HflC [Sphingomonas morindae]USI74591.1 protease modulator HflC [Sphingomonas morindae]